jgi:hypothetical protein
MAQTKRSTELNDRGDKNLPPIGAYSDDIHLESPEGLEIGDYGYKFRHLDGLVVPPYVTPARYALSRELTTRPGDVCYISFPKSGSTWLAHILVRLLNNGEAPDDSPLRSHLHWVESSWTYPRGQEELDTLPSPRIFKSHMPYHMALGGDPATVPCRYIYIARNPKDVAVSYYHFESEQTWSGNYNGPWEHWLDLFLAGQVQRGNWFDHVLGWWNRSDANNILFLKYEDLVMDFQQQLDRLVRFLGLELDPNTRRHIQVKTSFRNMSSDHFSNMHEIEGFQGFFREGRIGSWRDQFSEEQSRRFDEHIEKRLGGSGLEFVYG